ncbi:hypothetical protein L6164_036024 [Bauhinia variegata]|uniref:Uncharacterized protein n=1 Tax=Bauhinia variegata TaxID=167791 RepID=A0ACB9KFP6_BAUVA|nr:hypothetical protein L6164_036024 [Bauhinia variegata]
MALTLRWVVYLACHVLGHSKDGTEVKYEQVGRSYSNAEEKSLKGLSLQNSGFRMPLHYPRYKKSDYENMEEWKVDLLLKEYGLSFKGTLDEKRAFAMGAFLWPDQY